jgi:hypothetical protein
MNAATSLLTLPAAVGAFPVTSLTDAEERLLTADETLEVIHRRYKRYNKKIEIRLMSGRWILYARHVPSP